MFIRTQNNSPLGGLGCLLGGILGLAAAYYIVRGVFYVLWWAAPVLFLLAVVINWKSVANTGKALLSLFQSRPIAGLLTAGLAVLLFPLTALWLFLSALAGRRMEQVMGQFRQQKGPTAAPLEDEFTEFEELESRPKTPLRREQEPLEPPSESKKPQNPYDQMFE